MSTFIDGIGASENLDSSGERIIIAGLDISSLDKDGVFNYEHKNDQPSQIVGKVLKAKKIFSDKDCEDERQKYFWQKVQTPYLYVMGELFDEYKDSAKDVAGMFRYDAAKKGQNERNVMNFSVEGAKISKEGMDITRSIARKITITILPCNKMAIAEMVPSSESAPKDDTDSIFKTENSVEIELFKIIDPIMMVEMIKKEKSMKKDLGGGLSAGGGSTALSGSGPSSPSLMSHEKNVGNMKKSESKGNKIGATSSGKDIFSHGRVGDYGFSSQEHREAAQAHMNEHNGAKTPAAKQHHGGKASLHLGASKSAGKREMRGNVPNRPKSTAEPAVNAKPSNVSNPKLHDPHLSGKIKPPGPARKSEGMNKGLDAGSGNAAPGQLGGGAVLGRESLDGKKQNTFKKSKSKWLARAEQEYGKWEKREEFEKFMAKRMPHMAKHEIQAIGKTLALSKSLRAEKALAKVGAQNYQNSYIDKSENKKK